MRYLITLLIVLSFIASFGVLRLEPPATVGAGRFSIAVGGSHAVIIPQVGGSLGMEYGLSDYLSIGLNIEAASKQYDGSGSFMGGSLGFNLKGSYEFEASPFCIGLSLSVEYFDYKEGFNNYSPDEGDFLDYRYRSGLGIKGSFAFQAWFVYLGFQYTQSFEVLLLLPSLGFDIDFNEDFSMLIELGLGGGLSLGLEFSF